MTDNKKSIISALSRRDILRGAAGAGALATFGAIAPIPAWAQTALAIPRIGGRIRVASMSSSTADTLDPAKGSLSTDYVRQYMIYSGLTQYDPHLKAQPALAESIETSDQISWKITLRKGVVF